MPKHIEQKKFHCATNGASVEMTKRRYTLRTFCPLLRLPYTLRLLRRGGKAKNPKPLTERQLSDILRALDLT